MTIKGKQLEDESLDPRFWQIESGNTSDFGLNSKGVLCFRGKVFVPKDTDLRCRFPSCWIELGGSRILGLELVSNTEDKVRLIRDRLKVTADRQKSYIDLKCKEIEYSSGDIVFLKVSPLKRHCRFDPAHVISVEEIEIRPDLSFEEEPIQILERDVKALRRKSIPLVKVLWCNHNSEEATWEPEEVMQQQYPYLF
ncbi:uncharacterized protein [Gossypium hirsutum]|uniref:DNA/RNA polymerases superfamily protein n=1 Tax=Gossypium hirsutum TaxID=3635 RepID=A0A1U8PNG7_GOSHI|nr:uncharacterized protein LOC107961003 [Gossypium hirsutum]